MTNEINEMALKAYFLSTNYTTSITILHHTYYHLFILRLALDDSRRIAVENTFLCKKAAKSVEK